MDNVRERLGRELARLEPSDDGFQKTLRRVRRRERNRKLMSGTVGLLLFSALGVGLWLNVGSPRQQPATGSSTPPAAVSGEPRLFFAGNGQLWTMDIRTESVQHLQVPELAAGDPPYRIVSRGGKLVLYGANTYLLDPAVGLTPKILVKGSSFFIPSAAPDRVWAVFANPAGQVRALREVSVDGRVTVPDTRPPGGLWPVAATNSGVVFQLPDGQLEVWDPSTGQVVRRLQGMFPVATYGDLLAWCATNCNTLHVTNVVTGDDVAVEPPAGSYGFDPYRGSFSPDGGMIAVPTRTRADPTSLTWRLALVDLETRVATAVRGTGTSGAYVYVAWSPSGQEVFTSGQGSSEERIAFEYQLGAQDARRLRVKLAAFYGMAAS